MPKRPAEQTPVRYHSVWPNLTLMILPDGAAGAETVKACAYWERVVEQAVEDLGRHRQAVAFLEQWLALPKAAGVKLKV